MITTAQVPGKQAPLLIMEDMVAQMAPGSVIIDLAAEHGGNCALTRLNEEVERNGVTILGPGNLPATIPTWDCGHTPLMPRHPVPWPDAVPTYQAGSVFTKSLLRSGLSPAGRQVS